MSLILIFILANMVNIIISTVKTIVTVKDGILTAAIVNMLTFGFYTYVVILTANCDIPTLTKCIIVGVLNFICVAGVKLVEKKMRKTKLWKIEATFKTDNPMQIYEKLKDKVPMFYVPAGVSHYVFNCYCSTKEQSSTVQEVVEKFNGRYIILESGGKLDFDNNVQR